MNHIFVGCEFFLIRKFSHENIFGTELWYLCLILISGGAEQQQQEELEEDQVVPSAGDQVVPQVDQDQLEDSEQPEPGEEPEVQQPKASRSSSSSPSLYSEPPDPDEGQLLLHSWEGVLREGTATPSEAQGGGGRQGEQGGSGGGSGGGEGGEVGGGSPEGQQDVSSGPDMVNDSSAEDEPGVGGGGGGGGGVHVMGEDSWRSGYEGGSGWDVMGRE